MKNSKNLKLILEIHESIEDINHYISNQDRQIAVMHFNSLEKRIHTIQSVHPKNHIINQILDKIYTLHISDLYQELEQDIEVYGQKGVIITAGENNE